MNKELIFDTGIVLDPERINGYDFKVPLIRWNGYNYKFDGLHLPNNWQEEIPRLSGEDHRGYNDYLGILCKENGLDWELHLNEKTGLVTEIKFSGNQNSRIYLSTGFGISGIYFGENIQNLRTAIIGQDFLAQYLSFVTNNKNIYPYMAEGANNQWGSIDLAVPQKIFSSDGVVTNEYYQRQFELRANNIAGQFGQTLNYVRFDDKGILQLIQVDGDDCNYHLGGELNHEYLSHNVDNPFQAAALHVIAAQFINDLLLRK